MMKRVRQRGNTLLIVLILLVVFSLFAVSAFNSSNTNLKVIGNMQARTEGASAAQLAIEQTIRTLEFTINPANIAATPINVDIDRNGTTDYTVQRTPAPKCFRTLAVKAGDLDPANAADIACMQSGVAQSSGIDSAAAAATSGNSMCANSEWNIRAEATDARTGIKVAADQGVAIRLLDTDAANNCN